MAQLGEDEAVVVVEEGTVIKLTCRTGKRRSICTDVDTHDSAKDGLMCCCTYDTSSVLFKQASCSAVT